MTEKPRETQAESHVVELKEKVNNSSLMKHRNSLQAGVEELEKAGVSRIAVVGLFISPHSFRHQTEYLLGLRADPPEEFLGPHAHMLDLLTTRRC